MAQIRARTQFWFAGVLCFANDFIGKNMRDIVLVNGNERHGFSSRGIAKDSRDARARQAKMTAATLLFYFDQFAVFSAKRLP